MKTKLTKDEVIQILGKIEWEGFDYYFDGYVNIKNLKDEHLKKLVLNYRDIKSEIEHYLKLLREHYNLEDYEI